MGVAGAPLGKLAIRRSLTTTGPNGNGEFIASSDALQKLLTMVQRVARSSAAVLIWGETGTGKELVARAVHQYSSRAHKPLIDINCAALPENLVESELFGYEKGAFSGADSPKAGLFEMADKGTLFLDEIGELDLKVQAKLLRVLDGAPYYRLGGNRKITVDVRLIAATNRDLEEAVRKGTFRADLFHRIAQFQFHVPPLRERPDDIAPLACHFLRQQGAFGSRFSAEALKVLAAHPWPGNARELRNAVVQASIAADGQEIQPEHLPIRTAPSPQSVGRAVAATGMATASETLDGAERAAVQRALDASANNHTAAAELLGISRRTLLRKLKQYREASTTQPPALGKLSPQQHQSYRSAADIAATIKTSKEFFHVRIVNVSQGGIGIVGIANAFALTDLLGIAFSVPQGAIEATGRMVWASPEGQIGIQFVSLEPASRQRLAEWLRVRQMEDGWAVQEPLPGGDVHAAAFGR